MSKSLSEKRWPWMLGALLIVAGLAWQSFEIRFSLVGDVRQEDSVAAIRSLAERDDVNVLFILVDTLRADRLGAYGYERNTSPSLDQLATGGVRFARHLSQSSWTKCSMASLWTSLNPTRTGVTRFDHVISEEAVMPAELLREAGFQTIALFRNGWVAPNFGFAQGFDTYVRPTAARLPRKVVRENPTLTDKGTDADVVTAAREFLRVNGDERWFLYLHMMDLHEFLYDEDSAIFGSTSSDLYDNSILSVDRVLGDFFVFLAEAGLQENTIIVVGSDHGEAFLERGHEGHARRVFRETTEVPFLVSLPFRLSEELVVETRSRNIDVWPTVLDLLGIEPPDYIDGRSLVPDILAAASGEPLPEELAVAELDMRWGQESEEPAPTTALVQGPWRYVREEVNGGRSEYLFDASRDPKELRNLVRANPPELEELRERADAHLEIPPQFGEAPTRELGELELNQLRALGYALP